MPEEPEKPFHVPVLAEEVFQWLSPPLGEDATLVDCTLGGGGHAEIFLERIPSLTVVGIDRDADALAEAANRLARFFERTIFRKGNFSDVAQILQEAGVAPVDAILYDLGVSSFQLDQPGRGFQFRGGAPLDMRMDRESGVEAKQVVNNYSEKDLVRILRAYGDERFAPRVARAIVQRRATKPFLEGEDLADVVKHAIPAATRRTGLHPARRTFQAIRMEVNREVESLEESLIQSVDNLATGGRAGAISYHSGEDRIVKSRFRELAKGCICPRDFPVCRCEAKAKLRLLSSKPIVPGEVEIARNPRAKSAKFRVAEKLGGELPPAA